MGGVLAIDTDVKFPADTRKIETTTEIAIPPATLMIATLTMLFGALGLVLAAVGLCRWWHCGTSNTGPTSEATP